MGWGTDSKCSAVPGRTLHDVVPSGANTRDQVPRLVDELFGDTGRRTAVGAVRTSEDGHCVATQEGGRAGERTPCAAVDPWAPRPLVGPVAGARARTSPGARPATRGMRRRESTEGRSSSAIRGSRSRISATAPASRRGTARSAAPRSVSCRKSWSGPSVPTADGAMNARLVLA